MTWSLVWHPRMSNFCPSLFPSHLEVQHGTYLQMEMITPICRSWQLCSESYATHHPPSTAAANSQPLLMKHGVKYGAGRQGAATGTTCVVMEIHTQNCNILNNGNVVVATRKDPGSE